MADSLQNKLYKYRCWSENTHSMLFGHTVYFSSPFDFNDPFDCGLDVLCSGKCNQKVIESIAFGQVEEKFPMMPLVEKVECAKQIGDQITEDHLGVFQNISRMKVFDEITKHCSIFCLSEVNNDILMWSHYADCHRGVCLEYSVGKDHQPFQNLCPVIYSDEFPSVNLHDLVTDEGLRGTAPWMLTKATAWAYEKEWRGLCRKV